MLLDYPACHCQYGFQHDPKLTNSGVANSNFLQRTLNGETPKADVVYHPAFTGTG